VSDPSGASDFAHGQVVTVFRSRLRPENTDAYEEEAPVIHALAASMPGFVDAKTFVADDGERLTVVTFSDMESQLAWRRQADHAAAQARGRSDYYAEYSIQVCTTVRVNRFN
jgi:heme-degrading monooxygenase HmoA